jgi:hypothetical protein
MGFALTTMSPTRPMSPTSLDTDLHAPIETCLRTPARANDRITTFAGAGLGARSAEGGPVPAAGTSLNRRARRGRTSEDSLRDLPDFIFPAGRWDEGLVDRIVRKWVSSRLCLRYLPVLMPNLQPNCTQALKISKSVVTGCTVPARSTSGATSIDGSWTPRH